MTVVRVLVDVDAKDLALIRAESVERSTSETQIITDAIHSAAQRIRRRTRPLQLRRFASGDPTFAERSVVMWADDFRESDT